MIDDEESTDETSDTSIDGMMQYLENAKKLEKRTPTRRQPRLSGLQRKIATRANTAVLASNHPARLDELATYDAVTHRSSKKWKSAKIGVESHGRLPIYYRQDGMITHTGVITNILLDPAPDSAPAQEFLKHISSSDTYSEYFDELDTTTYIVEHGVELDEPFPQTALIKVSNDEPIAEDFSRQPSYVYQREGDFTGLE